MKKSLIFAAILAVMAGFSSCSLKNDVSFGENDLIGTWQENGKEAFMRFTSEKADTEYKYGYEWDEAEDIFPEDLIKYGNGWFKWKLVKADLTQIHLMDNGGAEIPKVYTVTKLTDTDLQFKDEFEVTHNYKKVVNSK